MTALRAGGPQRVLGLTRRVQFQSGCLVVVRTINSACERVRLRARVSIRRDGAARAALQMRAWVALVECCGSKFTVVRAALRQGLHCTKLCSHKVSAVSDIRGARLNSVVASSRRSRSHLDRPSRGALFYVHRGSRLLISLLQACPKSDKLCCMPALVCMTYIYSACYDHACIYAIA